MSDVIQLVKWCIKGKLHLKQKAKKWQLSENGVTIEFEAPNHQNSFGFSLDPQNVNVKDVFPFFADRRLARGIAKRCDGIIVLNYKQKTYIFLLEQKTNNPGDCETQLINGFYFCQWLFALLKEHEHYAGDIKYIGLVYSSRLRPNKETSTHQKPELESEKYGVRFFETNNKTTHLQSYIDA